MRIFLYYYMRIVIYYYMRIFLILLPHHVLSGIFLSDRIQFLPGSGCVDLTVWMHHMDADKMYRGIKKKLDGNCTRILWAILNKSRKQHPMKQQLYGHLLPISKTI